MGPIPTPCYGCGTHSHTLLRLVVYLFLWLQTQDIAIQATYSRLSKCDSRPVISAEPAHHHRVESPPRNSEPNIGTWGTASVDMFATVHNMHLPQFMSPVPEPQALAIDGRGRSVYMFPLFPLLSQVAQKLRTTQEGEEILIVLVAITTVVSTPAMSVSGPPLLLSIPPRPTEKSDCPLVFKQRNQTGL